MLLKANEEKNKLPGIQIDRVIPDGPAEKTRLLRGDRFLSVEGTEIRDGKGIHQALERKGWGNEITFAILQHGSKREVTVKLLSEGN